MATHPIELLQSQSATGLESPMALLNLRPRQQGDTSPGVACRFPKFGRVAGYAVTCVYAVDGRAMHGHRENHEPWSCLEHVAGPKVVAMVDVSPVAAAGSMSGRLNAHVHKALGCRGAVTNGSLRDVDEIATLGIQDLSGRVGIIHGSPHRVGFGRPVELDGVPVIAGEIVVADAHGTITIPKPALAHLPDAIGENERRIHGAIALSWSAGVTAAGVAALVDRNMSKAPPWKPPQRSHPSRRKGVNHGP